MAATGWKRPFADPIPLPGGRQLVTLEDAAGDIMKLPKAEQNLGEWQAARAIVFRGHGQVPNASMDARSMSTTITFGSDGAGLRSHWSRHGPLCCR